MEYIIYRSDELTHHGILGMKWGVRRYQRKDGSLTPAGKKRRAKLEAEIEKLGGKKNGKGDSNDGSGSGKKPISEMTDNELATAINRARMEDAYKQLRPEPTPVEKNPLMKKMINEVVVPAAVTSGKQFLQNALTKAGENILKDKVDPNSLEALKKTYEKLDYELKIDKIKNPDKYISEEDKNKRQEREFKAEDRAARKEGYKDAADKAANMREAAEASRKAEADEAARVANVPKSREYYNSVYRNKGIGKENIGSNKTTALALYNSNSSKPITSLTTKPNVSRGKSIVADLLDGPVTIPKSDERLMTYDENGNFIGYWTDIRGDSDVII